MGNSTSFLHCLNLGLIVLTLLVNPLSCNGQHMFIFGDSLYDSGNKQYITRLYVTANHHPYGISVGKATGRWSDGLIVPDYIAGFLGIPQIPPVLDKEADLSYGANYATAGATALGNRKMCLYDQVSMFVSNKTTWTNDARATALYLLYIGSEDYINFIYKYSEPSLAEQQALIREVVRKIKESIIIIHKAGGRKFAFQNMVPLGCLLNLKLQYSFKDKCMNLPSHMAEEHNKLLLQALSELEATLDGFMYSVYDYFSSTMRRLNDLKRYTYTMGNVACCGTGFNNGVGCGSLFFQYDLCPNPDDYFFFDGKHTTQKANEQVARLMWSADPVVIDPMNIRELNAFPSLASNEERKFQNYGIDLKTLMTK